MPPSDFVNLLNVTKSKVTKSRLITATFISSKFGSLDALRSRSSARQAHLHYNLICF